MPVTAVRQTFAGTASDTTLPFSAPDRVMSFPTFDQGGIRHLFDLNNPATGLTAAPSNGQLITDISGRESGVFTLSNGSAVANAGGGIDFTGANPTAAVEIPASVAANIRGDGTVPQYFSQVLYVKLPTKALWTTSAGGVKPISCFTSASNGFISEADLLSILIVVIGSTPYLRFNRQTGLGPATFDEFNIPVPDVAFGTVVQLVFWRNASGQVAQLTYGNGLTLQATKTVSANNTADFSTKRGRIGIGTSFYTTDTVGKAWRVYRGWVENLRMSGRDPAAVAASDYQRRLQFGRFI